MTDDRFNALLNGQLSHPLMPFVVTRLAMALRHVVEATGQAGDDALEHFCAELEAADDADAADR